MPEEFYKRIYAMRKNATLTLICSVLLIMCIGITIISAFYHFYLFIILCIISAALILLMFYSNRNIKKKKEKFMPYRISIPLTTKEDIQKSLMLSYIIDDDYISFLHYKRYTVRLLTQFTVSFVSDIVKRRREKANRLINAQYKVKHNTSFFSHDVRINLIVCEQEDRSLLNWLTRNTSLLLDRHEAILLAAIVTDSNELLLPALFDNVDIRGLSAYQVAVELLVSRLTGTL